MLSHTQIICTKLNFSCDHSLSVILSTCHPWQSLSFPQQFKRAQFNCIENFTYRMLHFLAVHFHHDHLPIHPNFLQRKKMHSVFRSRYLAKFSLLLLYISIKAWRIWCSSITETIPLDVSFFKGKISPFWFVKGFGGVEVHFFIHMFAKYPRRLELGTLLKDCDDQHCCRFLTLFLFLSFLNSDIL